MNLSNYVALFNYNIFKLSRTVNGVLDISSSKNKKNSIIVNNGNKAKYIVYKNMQEALKYVYKNRYKNFKSSKDLANFIIQIAKITNSNIVNNNIFRNWDSTKYNYTKVDNLQKVWEWFSDILFYMISKNDDSCFVHKNIFYCYLNIEKNINNIKTSPLYIASFCEYIINAVGHFFSDGCGKISILLSTYIFMRYNLHGIMYNSRDEYYYMLHNNKCYSLKNINNLFINNNFKDYVCYYKSLYNKYNKLKYKTYIKKYENNIQIELTVTGVIDEFNIDILLNHIIKLLNNLKINIKNIKFNFAGINYICLKAAKKLKDFYDNSSKFQITKANKLTSIVLDISGLKQSITNCISITQHNLCNFFKLTKGCNAIIYSINNHKIIKLYNDNTSVQSIFNEILGSVTFFMGGRQTINNFLRE